jgi:hypothetical protein
MLCSDSKSCEGTPCAFDTSLNAVSSLIVKLTKAYSSEKALHLLFGYWRTFGSFQGFDEFADGIEAAVGGSMMVNSSLTLHNKFYDHFFC